MASNTLNALQGVRRVISTGYFQIDYFVSYAWFEAEGIERSPLTALTTLGMRPQLDFDSSSLRMFLQAMPDLFCKCFY